MKRWSIAICSIIVSTIILGIGFSTHVGRNQRASTILSKVLQTEGSGHVVEQFGASEGTLFGDSSYAWQLNISHVETNWVGKLKRSDDDDLSAAVRSIEYLLHTQMTPESKRAVLRMKLGDWSVYVVTGDDTNRIHLLVHTL
jgi:hypothetical protein